MLRGAGPVLITVSQVPDWSDPRAIHNTVDRVMKPR